MVYIKYSCLVCGVDVEEVFDFSSQDAFPSVLGVQACDIHKGL